MRAAFSLTTWVASKVAVPSTAIDLDPKVPIPMGLVSVSPWKTRMSSKGMPRPSDTIWAQVVW